MFGRWARQGRTDPFDVYVVVDQFNAAWTHPTKVPEIRMIYRIIPAPSVWDSYWAYR